jgi:two-component system, NtrC family, sensor kinase
MHDDKAAIDSRQIIADLQRELAECKAERDEAIARQAATTQGLQTINASLGDLGPVFEAMLDNALHLCEASFGFVTTYDGERYARAAQRGVPDELTEYFKAGIDQPRPGDAHWRLVAGENIIHNLDQMDEEAYRKGNPLRRAVVDLGGARSALVVALRKEGVLLGALTIYRKEVRPFSDKQVALLKSFATQAVIAIENARLFEEVQARNRDLNEALEQQTATAEILSKISRSPADIQPVFDMIAQSSTRLCEAQFCFVADYDGALVHFVAQHGLPTETVEGLQRAYPRPPSRASTSARTILSGRVEQIPDVEADPDYELLEIDKRAYRSMVGVPILKDGRPIGAFVVGRSQPGLFTERQIKLLETFADQAVIAIENVRLFTEVQARNRDLNEALEQQTATAEVLKVISRSAFDLQSVLDTLTESAAQLCRADMAGITRPVGKDFYYATNYNFSPDWLAYVKDIPLRWDRGSIVGRVLLDRDVVQVADVLADPEYTYSEPARKAGYRTFLGVPLLREGEAIGVLVLARNSIAPFTDKQIELLVTFADQAVIAIENARLFEEVRTRNHELGEALERQAATSEILRAISRSPTDAKPVFDTIAECAARLCKAEYCAVFTFDGQLLHPMAYHGISRQGIEAAQGAGKAIPDRGSATGRAILSGAIEQIPDVLADSQYRMAAVAQLVAFRSTIAVPMMQSGRPIGVITVLRSQAGHFPGRDVELLQTFSEQALIAIENVRLFTELEARNRDLNEALEQQTATADVLKVISRSAFDLQNVLDTLVQSAARLCEADMVSVTRQKADSNSHYHVASHGFPPGWFDFMQTFPLEPDRGTLIGRTLVEGRAVHIPDVLADPEYTANEGQRLGGFRTMLGVPLLREGSIIGVFLIARRVVKPFTEKQIELVTTFADQAVIAIENVRLFDRGDSAQPRA